jgi:hypothetical protein
MELIMLDFIFNSIVKAAEQDWRPCELPKKTDFFEGVSILTAILWLRLSRSMIRSCFSVSGLPVRKLDLNYKSILLDFK